MNDLLQQVVDSVKQMSAEEIRHRLANPKNTIFQELAAEFETTEFLEE